MKKEGPSTRKISTREPGVAPAAPSSATTHAAWDGSSPILAQQVGLLAGTYEPLIELASGGMARVFVGRRVGASGFERLVVIKQVHRHLLGRADFANFFRDEARIASLIHHANVVPVIDVVEAPGELLLVMEYVESVSLSLLRSVAAKAKQPIPNPVVFRIFLDMLAGLHAAHDLVDGEGRPLDVVHRDVSPQNLIVGLDGVSRLIDFGVAKAAHRLTETESGDIKGKYAYMSPEQVAGLPVDRRSDVFAAAVVLFETLTGVRLFAGEHAMETLRRVVDDPLPDLRGFPNVPEALHEVFEHALAKDAAQRIATAAELADRIESSVTAASHRRVGEWVSQACGGLLAERRALLEESRKAGVSRSGANRAIDEPASHGAGVLPARRPIVDEDVPTLDGAPPSMGAQRTQLLAPAPPRAADESIPAQAHTNVVSSSDLSSEVGRMRRGGARGLVAALAAVVVLGLVATTVWTVSRSTAARTEGASGPASTGLGVSATSLPSMGPSSSPTIVASPPSGALAASTLIVDAGARSEGLTRKPANPRRPQAPAAHGDDLQADPYGTK